MIALVPTWLQEFEREAGYARINDTETENIPEPPSEKQGIEGEEQD